MRRTCVRDCLHRPSHSQCSSPHPHVRRLHPFYAGFAWVLLRVLKYFRVLSYDAEVVALLVPTSSIGYQLDIWQTPGAPCSLLVGQV